MLGEDNQADQARAMQQQMPGGASPQLMDEQKAFKAEWEGLKVAEHRNALNEVEKVVLRMWEQPSLLALVGFLCLLQITPLSIQLVVCIINETHQR